MASEPTTEELQAEHSSPEQPTENRAVSGADYDSEDVSLDELMMDADDEDAVRAEEPLPQSVAGEELRASTEGASVDTAVPLAASPSPASPSLSDAAAESTDVSENSDLESDSSRDSNDGNSDDEDSNHRAKDSGQTANGSDASQPVLGERLDGATSNSQGQQDSFEAPAVDAAADSSVDEEATDLELEAVAREAMAPLVPSEETLGNPLSSDTDTSFSQAELAGMVDSLTASVSATARAEEPSRDSSQPTDLSIGAKTGDTSPLPALNEKAGRPAPAAEFATPPESPSFSPQGAAVSPMGTGALGSHPPEMSLSAMDEDEDDAVTQIGLPLHELEAAEAPRMRQETPQPRNAHQLHNTHQLHDAHQRNTPHPQNAPRLPMPPVDTRPAFQRSRSAATVVVSRVNPEMIPGGVAPQRPKSSSVLDTLSGLLKKKATAVPAFGSPQLPVRRARPKGLDMAALLPKISWALFGAGILALGIVWTSQQAAKGDAGTAVRSLQAKGDVELAASDSASQKPVQPGKATQPGAAIAVAKPSAIDRLAQQEGEVAKTRQAFEQFIAGVKAGTEQPRRFERFMQYAADSATRVPVFRELSSWENAQGPDTMYALWEKAPGGSVAADLAFELLYTPDQRAKASPALSVVLDLRQARTCEDYQAILPRVIEHADRRALLSLRPLVHREGCGDDGTEDCYGCLRSGSELSLGIAAAEAKSAPQL